MAIAFFVGDISNGYGDFLFGLKTVAGLKDHLKGIGYTDPIYLVTGEKGRDKIITAGGDKEFDVKVITIQEFNYLWEETSLTVDCYIEGPVFQSHSCRSSREYKRHIAIPEGVPVLLLPEYSVDGAAMATRNRFLNLKHSKVDIVYSGFNFDNQHGIKNRGILFTQALRDVAAKKNRGDFSFREHYWKDLESYPTLRGMKSQDEYHETTDLFFDYSANHQLGVPSLQANHCLDYLQMHALFVQESNKNQDIIAVSGDAKRMRKALNTMLPELEKNGFDKVIYVDLKTGVEENLYEKTFNDKDSRSFYPQKIYRLLHATSLTHTEMIAVLALSGDLVGVTGDQSLGEALSAKKLIVYECISHKKDLMVGMIKFFKKNLKTYTGTLLEKITQSNIDDMNEQEKNDLRDPNILLEYQNACEELHRQNELLKLIILTIKPVIFNKILKNDKDYYKKVRAKAIANLQKQVNTKIHFNSLADRIVCLSSARENIRTLDLLVENIASIRGKYTGSNETSLSVISQLELSIVNAYDELMDSLFYNTDQPSSFLSNLAIQINRRKEESVDLLKSLCEKIKRDHHQRGILSKFFYSRSRLADILESVIEKLLPASENRISPKP